MGRRRDRVMGGRQHRGEAAAPSPLEGGAMARVGESLSSMGRMKYIGIVVRFRAGGDE